MVVLGIETSLSQASVALLVEGGCFQRSTNEPQQHAERLLPLIERVAGEAGLGMAAFQRVAVGVGPGSFTGLRVGIALAQGLALGLGVELVGVSSLLALAAAAREPQDPDVLVPMVDGRRGDVFAAAYDRAGRELFAPLALPLDAAAAAVEAALGCRAFLGAGAMAETVLGPERTARRARVGSADAEWVARLGATLPPSLEVLPLYARAPDAVLPELRPNPLSH